MRYAPTHANLLHAHSDAPLLHQGIGHAQFARACSFPRDFALTSTSAEHIASSAVTCAAPRSQHCTHKHNKHNPQQTFHRQLCCTTACIITQPRRISTKLREMAIFPTSRKAPIEQQTPRQAHIHHKCSIHPSHLHHTTASQRLHSTPLQLLANIASRIAHRCSGSNSSTSPHLPIALHRACIYAISTWMRTTCEAIMQGELLTEPRRST